jgi:acetate kinase
MAAAATSLERLDGIVFTGEIGWDQPEVRAAIASRLHLLGVSGDLDARPSDDDRIVSHRRPVSEPDIPVLVILAQENRQLAIEAGGII